MLDIIASYDCMQFQGKLMIQTQENGEKPHFGPKFGPPIFFFKNLASSFTRCHSQLSSSSRATSEKANDPILRIFGRKDGQTEGQTDKQTDKSDFTERCPTKVERPTQKIIKKRAAKMENFWKNQTGYSNRLNHTRAYVLFSLNI